MEHLAIQSYKPTEMCGPPTKMKTLPTEWNKKMIKVQNNTRTIHVPKRTPQTLTNYNFHGLIAPVFTCMKCGGFRTMDISNVGKYAAFLQSQKVIGVLVNSIIGEGPALSIRERKRNAEAWSDAAYDHNLIMILEIGGAPIADVIDMAKHAEKLCVHAVMLLPDLFYKPRNLEQLIGYCKIISKHCKNRGFFYCHNPSYTGVNLDMPEFCEKAAEAIPNFLGIQYWSSDLETGVRCMGGGRVVTLGIDVLMASGLLMGFEAILNPAVGIRPDICWEILTAMHLNDLPLARGKQKQLNNLIDDKVRDGNMMEWVSSLKNWFNREMRQRPDGFSVGPARRLF